LQFEPGVEFDLVTCFQVLEHVPEPKAFARKLLDLGKVVVVSVPYKWRKGKVRFHPNDPVDEAKLTKWFGRTPVYSHLSEEIELDRAQRLIQVYAKDSSKVKEADKAKAPPGILFRITRAVKKRLQNLRSK
jgi:hypothetical protein